MRIGIGIFPRHSVPPSVKIEMRAKNQEESSIFARHHHHPSQSSESEPLNESRWIFFETSVRGFQICAKESIERNKKLCYTITIHDFSNHHLWQRIETNNSTSPAIIIFDNASKRQNKNAKFFSFSSLEMSIVYGSSS